MALTIAASLFDGNTAQTQGGGIYAKLGTLTLSDSQVFRNQATGNTGGQGGGGLIVISATATITDTTFAGNSATQFGGGMFFHQGSAVTVERTNIYANTAGSGPSAGGGGIFVTRTAPLPTGVVRNSVIADNTNFQIQEEACPPLTAPILQYRNNTLAALSGGLYNSTCFPPGVVNTATALNALPSGRTSGNVDGIPSFVSFAAIPDRAPSVLAWSVARATSVTITGATGPFEAPTGTKDVSPTGNTQYLLSASTPSGSRSGSATVQSCAPTLTLTRNMTQLRPGQALTVSLDASNPAGCPAAEVYAGIVLPDNVTALFFSGPGVIGATTSLSTPNRFVILATLAPGATVSQPALLQFTLPPTGVPPGTYQLFAAVARTGAFTDNRIDAGDVLAVSVLPVTILP
jgi:predicted outer membrane repeat protein